MRVRKFGFCLAICALFCFVLAGAALAGGHHGSKPSPTFQNNSAKVNNIGVGKKVTQVTGVGQNNLKMGKSSPTFQNNSAKVNNIGVGKKVYQETFIDQGNAVVGY